MGKEGDHVPVAMLGDHPSSSWASSKHFIPRGCRMKDAQSMFVKSMR